MEEIPLLPSLTGCAPRTACILAGGLGTRLRPVVSDRPKVLADVDGRPFLTHLLDGLTDHGLERVILCTGYLAEQVTSRLGTRYRGMSLHYSVEGEPLGTGGALRQAAELLAPGELTLVLNGDSLATVDLTAFMSWHRVVNSEASVALARVPDMRSYGQVEVGPTGRVRDFVEKGTGAGPGWVNAGIYLLSAERLGTIPTPGAVSLERTCLPAWIDAGVYGYQSAARFLDIGTPTSYAHAADWLRHTSWSSATHGVAAYT